MTGVASFKRPRAPPEVEAPAAVEAPPAAVNGGAERKMARAGSRRGSLLVHGSTLTRDEAVAAIGNAARASAPGAATMRRRSVARKMVPTVRRRGLLEFTAAGTRARLRIKHEMTEQEKKQEEEEEEAETAAAGLEPEASAEDETAMAQVLAVLEKNKFAVELVQLGADFRIGFSSRFLMILSQFSSELSLFVTKGKSKSRMPRVEDDALAGTMDKPRARVVLLGDLPQDRPFQESLLSGELPDETRRASDEVDPYAFATNCFQLDESFPDLRNNPLNWVGVAIVKRADVHPITPKPAVYFTATLGKLEEDKAEQLRQLQARQEEKASLEKKLTEISSWTPGQGLKAIRKLLKPKLRYFDRDGSGTIEFDEFKAVTENLGLFLTEARLQRLFAACDLDRNGTIELDELPLALHINDKLPVTTHMGPKECFELFDYDGSGELNEQEFFEVVQTLAVAPISREDAAKLFSEHDKDKSGLIEYSEFREIWLDICNVEQELTIRLRRAAAAKGDDAAAAEGTEEPQLPKPKQKWREVLAGMVEEEERKTEESYQAAIDAAYEDARALRLEHDIRRKEQKKIRKREALAARVATSKAERELRRQKQLEKRQRKLMEEKEQVLRAQLKKEIRYREEKARLERKEERELKQRQEKEARARRGDDRLELPAQGLRQLPKEVYMGKAAQEKLAHLVNMDLSSNKLEALPADRFLFWCGSLRRLDLSHNRLGGLPEELEALESLQILQLSHNRLFTLPPQLSALKSLVVLNVAENELRKLPAEIAQLAPELTTLVAYRNALETVPPELGALTRLELLDLSLNCLRWLPDQVTGLAALRHLDLSWNRLQKFPAGIGQLGALQVLNMSGNELRRLPNDLDGLHGLQELDLGRNDLIEIPESVSGLVSLLKLDVSHNKVLRLPDSIGELRRLQHLLFASNRVRALPGSLGKLRSLVMLDARGNRIHAIPPELGALSKLQRLDLAGNAISGRLPESLGSLRTMSHCRLADNKIEALPASFGALASLRCLDLNGNQLSRLPDTVSFLRNLEVLRVSRNRLCELPRELGALARSLREFDLSSNLLEWLPADIANCKLLRVLDLHHNRLKALPHELGHLVPSFDYFRVTHNPLSALPRKFSNDVSCREPSQLLWSGYSDGQVADWLIEVADVIKACDALIDVGRLWCEGGAAQEQQTLSAFMDAVRDQLEQDGIWREQLVVHVKDYYFRAKALGAKPRLDALYGADATTRKQLIRDRQEHRAEIIARVKAEEEALLDQLDKAYSTSRQRLLYAEGRIDDRVAVLRQAAKEATRNVVAAGEACFHRQEKRSRELQAARRGARQAELRAWLDHFLAARGSHIDRVKVAAGYEEQDLDAERAGIF